MNRPEKLNALNDSLRSEIDAALRHVETDDNVRVVVLTGKGRCFSAGADMSGDRSGIGVLGRWERYKSQNTRQFSVWELSKPVIAAVHGYCLGRGLELALWCDIIVASEDARLGQPEVRHGSIVASMVPWLTTPQQAKLFMWTGDQINAREAERIGLVTCVVPEGKALDEALKMARRIAHVPPTTARTIKRWINNIYQQMGLYSAQESGAAYAALVSVMPSSEKGTEELDRIKKEKGMKAFIKERDKPFKK